MEKFLLLLCLCNGLARHAQTKQKGNPLSNATWITTTDYINGAHRQAPIFYKSLRFDKPVKRAILYISALGLYEAKLNGKKIGSDYFTPGFVDYNQRIPYQVYDISTQIKADNELSVTVGEGWYRGIFRGSASDNEGDHYGKEAGLIACLHLVFTDGTKKDVVTDRTWQSAYGPIFYSGIYEGELFDANIIATPKQAVKILDHSKASLFPSSKEPVRAHEHFAPESTWDGGDNSLIIDFGQNLAGWVQLKCKGLKGDSLKIEHAEVLDKDGGFYTANLRNATATDIYVLNGIQSILNPHFTYHGFRYARLTWIRDKKNIPIPETGWSAEAVALYTDLKHTGTFACSEPVISRLQKNIEWSLNSNFFEIPTDCPQRSERLGWTGDAQVFAPTACFLRNTKKFYSSWLNDLAGEQGENGGVPTYIPTVEPHKPEVKGVAGWGDAATIVPWTVYETYADKKLLEQQYSSMKAWVDYIQGQSNDGLWEANGYGDWYAMGPSTKLPLIDQCYWARSAQILAAAAKVLGKTADAVKYAGMVATVKSNFMKTYVNADGSLKIKTQTAYVLALAFDMLPEDKRADAANRLVTLIRQNDDHLATGFLGTPFLLKVLADYGYADVAYKLLNQKTMPSWLYPITMGATTIWEKWNGMGSDGAANETSYNHYSYGAVGLWLYEYVAGIRKAAPGYKKVLIKPIPGGNLTWAKATYQISYGMISSEWHTKGNQTNYEISIPKGTTASIELPNQKVKKVGPGHYQYTINNL
ncbi:Bacterial alpha-L-rhamnosidase [Mucilaginibacter corticis]|uniref:alpha-L-rhamnosidase n=1 Tax=Mucilaginibacter corticis TaxID=2597670 RepID=A0A556M9T4_9SPHI|nr:alpha-L-rhamnosidase [Mucilaginibacter corticis]TSJ36575.1 Bacterial alpha-L-rhamnosidase [Mucilaginibacter corticis]